MSMQFNRPRKIIEVLLKWQSQGVSTIEKADAGEIDYLMLLESSAHNQEKVH